MKYRDIGVIGENIAMRYLKSCGYAQLFKNLKIGFYEIDLICLSPECVLVFIEVKTRAPISPFSNFNPEDNFSWRKRNNIYRSAEIFVETHPHLLGEEGWRVDLVAIEIHGKRFDLRHYPNA